VPLTDMKCRNARPGQRLKKLSDGGGLQLWIQPTGSRQWRLAYRFGGKQRLLALGPYPLLPLADARKHRDEAKRLLSDGIDPCEAKREAKRAQAQSRDTFRSIAEEYVSKLTKEGRAQATLTKLEWLLSFAYPKLGSRPIRGIAVPEVLEVLQKVEARGRYETARRLRSTIGSVFRYAIATARAEADPTIALKGALIVPRVTSHAAITDPDALGGLLRAIETYDGQPSTRLALKLLALLFTRPGELRLAEWPEFDLQKRVWTIPECRMKMRRPHRVPLSRQSIYLLEELSKLSDGEDLLFPSARSSTRPISDNTLNAALRRLGYAGDDMTAHGFRATASSLLNESGKWHPDAIERQLAHIESDDVRRAYARAEFWDERVRMMQWWADHLDVLEAGAAENRRGR
jgi:integrase